MGAGFTVLAIAATWPLARHLGSTVPSDLGDPLFVAWVMAWVARHLTAVATGDLGAFARMWNAPIFAPETNTLAYSEHFTGQVLLTLPITWLGGNPLHAYNVAFLASFALSALGMYLLVRALTGNRGAAAVAGCLYGFNVYRLYSLSHLHTLSGQWPAFALLGLLTFARTGSRRALAGGAAAYVLSALSSGYYLAYFTPLIALFAVAAFARHDGWRSARGGWAIAVAGVAAAGALVPFLLPYIAMQRELHMTRPRAEVEMFSLSLETYRTALPQLAAMLTLAATALFAWRRQHREVRWAAVVFALTGAAAFWLSLGPTPRLHGAPLGIPGLYGILLDYAPGFSGLRVASRFAMVLMFALSALAGIGMAAAWTTSRRLTLVLGGLALSVHLAMYWSVPFPRDAVMGVGTLNPVPAYLDPWAEVSPIYQRLATVEPAAVIVELPFGELAYELRYMYVGLVHGRPLLNGYSGVFPPSYRARAAALRAPWDDFARAWGALAPATYVVVHEGAWTPEQVAAVRTWLESHGARAIVEHDGARLWQLLPATH